MSQVLPTAHETTFRTHQYERFSTVKFSGEASDVGPDAAPVGAALEVHNMRHEGQSPFLVTRTGYRRFAYIETKDGSQIAGDAGPIHPIAKCEYVYWHPNTDGTGQTEFRADVTLSWVEAAKAVRILLLDKTSAEGTGTGWTAVTIKTNFAVKPTGCILQDGLYLIVSLFNDQSYIVWPGTITENTPAVGPRGVNMGAGATWNLEVLGKDACPVPSTYDFPRTLQGDLIVFSAHEKKGENDAVMEYDTVSDSDPTRITIRLPIDADYIRADDPAVTPPGFAPIIPQFRFANSDKTKAGSGDAGNLNHFFHRGYFYRFVTVRTLTLPDGSKVKIRSNPSTDIFIPAKVYAPFFWSAALDPDQNPPGFPNSLRFDETMSQWLSNVNWWHYGVDVDAVQPTPVPNIAAMATLQQKYRKYFDDTGMSDNNGTFVPLLWASQWLGWSIFGSRSTYFEHSPPYMCDPTAEDLTHAPQTIFDWANFGITDTNVTEIEVYRTAYEDVDPDVRATKTPNFKPHVYGLVGSIERDGKFTDTTKVPDFGADPSEFEGYERGQFSGDVSFQYGQSPAIVFGNVRVDYALLVPTTLVQAFRHYTGFGVYEQITDFVNAPDGNTALYFEYCYVDRDGYRSPVVRIPDPAPSIIPLADMVGFTFPYGYAPSIKKILLFRSQWVDGAGYSGAKRQDANGHREFKLIAQVEPEPGTYDSNGAEAGSDAGTTDGDHPKFYEPGAIIYSKPDQPWDWPQSQSEKHDYEPIRKLQDMMGELAVEADGSYNLTLLRTGTPRSERETRVVGRLSKHAGSKVEDVDIVLNAHGLYMLTPSRAEALRHPAENELAKYLTERIPAPAGGFYPPLANARRASIGYLDLLRELWLHIPSSVDLWPMLPDNTGALTIPNPAALPQRTFVFHFGPTVRDIEAYSFDLTTEFEVRMKAAPPAAPVIDRSTFNPSPVIFHPGSDGGLWASYTDQRPGFNGALVSVDCHYPQSDYPGYGSATIALGLEAIEGQKQIERTYLKLKARGEIQVITGPPKQTEGEQGDATSGWDPLRGHISDAAEVFDILRVRKNTARNYEHAGIDRALETKGSAVMVRVRTTPGKDSSHRVELRGLAVKYDQKHQGA